MRRRGLCAVVAIAFLFAASCSHTPSTVNAAQGASDHLFPTKDGRFYCKVTDSVFDASELQAHLGHRLAKQTGGHAGYGHALRTTRARAAVREATGVDLPVTTAQADVVGGPRATAGAQGCVPTAAQVAAASKLVADTRAAIAKYEQVSQALLASYLAYEGPGDDRAQYYVNDAYRRNANVLRPDEPEALVYGWTERHGLVLIGALYIMPAAGMRGPAIGGCLTRWHSDQTQDAVGPHELAEMLPVWIVDMPGGPFAPEADPDFVNDL